MFSSIGSQTVSPWHRILASMSKLLHLLPLCDLHLFHQWWRSLHELTLHGVATPFWNVLLHRAHEERPPLSWTPCAVLDQVHEGWPIFVAWQSLLSVLAAPSLKIGHIQSWSIEILTLFPYKVRDDSRLPCPIKSKKQDDDLPRFLFHEAIEPREVETSSDHLGVLPRS